MKTIAKIFLLTLITLSFSIGISAATFVVNTTDDTIDTALGNGACADANSNCSLRAAISEANALPGADIITLGAAAYTQTLFTPDDNSNASGDWDITSDITINGAGQDATILQSSATFNNGSDRVLEVLFGASLTLTDVTVRHGRAYTPSGFAAGGGINNAGTLSLDRVTVRDNSAITMSGSSIGGGIFNQGASLTLNDSTITGNGVTGAFVGGFGGGIGSSTSAPATIVITNSSITGNFLQAVASVGSGGGLYVGGFFDLTATGSHFDSNSSLGEQASEGGGARLVSVVGPSVFNITNCTFNGNAVRSTSTGATGGGLHLYTSSDTLTGTLDRVSINGNQTIGSGVNRGGGLYVNPVGAAINLDVTNSSISHNTNDGSRGGGVELSDRFSTTAASSTVNFTNTTISGNTAGTGNGGGSGSGGGAHIEMTTGPMTVNFNFVTITDNFAITNGGGVFIAPNHSSLVVRNSIIAGNGAGSGGQDISGPFSSQDYNHIGNVAGANFTPGAHDTSGFNPQLGLLQNNGGPTLSHLLAATSPLLDTIPLGVGGCGSIVSTDQRGVTRPFSLGCDKGATEFTGPWSLSGVIRTTTGMPIRNAAVTISGGSLPAPVTVFTGNLGTYQFTNLAGSEYEVSVSIKRYHFNNASQGFSLGSNITDADFIANAPFSREVMRHPAGK
ncbi:MAG TPA: choice-of-anchor Q domain-containing protein [Pyrinomonadaceae bacterium]|jgi:CSLREA domain-containing protein|nr:choice-of-anchor Q domain-containing protein [Pyrinomonadaceae bacterium]